MNEHHHTVVCPGGARFYCLTCGNKLPASEAWQSLDSGTVTALLIEARDVIERGPVQESFPGIDWGQYATAGATYHRIALYLLTNDRLIVQASSSSDDDTPQAYKIDLGYQEQAEALYFPSLNNPHQRRLGISWCGIVLWSIVEDLDGGIQQFIAKSLPIHQVEEVSA